MAILNRRAISHLGVPIVLLSQSNSQETIQLAVSFDEIAYDEMKALMSCTD